MNQPHIYSSSYYEWLDDDIEGTIYKGVVWETGEDVTLKLALTVFEEFLSLLSEISQFYSFCLRVPF